MIERQNLPGIFRTFDFASPDATSPQRFYTTVPQQALFLMNSPFITAQARALATRSAAVTHPEQRVQEMYRLVFARPASQDEIRLGLNFLHTLEHLPADDSASAAVEDPLTPWERYAQALLMSNEFHFTK